MKNNPLDGMPQEAQDITIKAIVDLNDFFEKILGSKKFSKYLPEANLLPKMMFCILSAFTIGQALSISKKSEIIDNETKKRFPPNERFALIMNQILTQMQTVAEETYNNERDIP